MDNHLRQDLTVYILLMALGLGMILAGATARPYHGPGYGGYAWDWGGVELEGYPRGLFLCPAEWNQFPYRVGSPWAGLRPLWGLLPVADC